MKFFWFLIIIKKFGQFIISYYCMFTFDLIFSLNVIN